MYPKPYSIYLRGTISRHFHPKIFKDLPFGAEATLGDGPRIEILVGIIWVVLLDAFSESLRGKGAEESMMASLGLAAYEAPR